MLLTITNTNAACHRPWVLAPQKPLRLQSFPLSFGQAHVFYPEATSERCTAALLLDVDPVALVRNRRGPSGEGGTLDQYVNDRPYVASSFLSVAIARVLGQCAGRQEQRTAGTGRHSAASGSERYRFCHVAVVKGFLRRLFEPLGYEVVGDRPSAR